MGRGRTRKTCVSDRHRCRTYDTFFCITLERLAKTNGMWPPRSGKRLGTVNILIPLCIILTHACRIEITNFILLKLQYKFWTCSTSETIRSAGFALVLKS